MLGSLIFIFRENINIYFYALSFVVLNGVICSSAIICSAIFGFGYETYSNLYGTTSFFKAQNDISLAILLSNVVNLYFYIRKKVFYMYLFFV